MLKNKSIGKRLKTVFMGLSLLVALSGVSGIFLILKISRDADTILQQKYPQAKIANELETDLNADLLALHSLILGEAAAENRMKQWHEQTSRHLEDLQSMDLEAADKNNLVKIQTARQKLEQLSSQLANLMKVEHTQAQMLALMDPLEAEIESMMKNIESIVEHAEADMNSTMKTADEAQIRGLLLLVAITVLAFIAAVWLGQKISLGITRPLNTLVGYSKHVASGNLTENITGEDAQDETGTLAKAFRAMTDSLRSITAAAEKIAQGDLTVKVTPRSEEDTLGLALQKMISSLRQQTQEIIDGASIIASSVSELSASSAQLASSAAENATSISETTTTVEEVRQTTELASAKSQQMADEARRIKETSRQGRKATDDTVAGMHKIQNQMNAIAETIVRLSEQSQAIGQIIATVDSLSEQSNVLAVNASIEAAKAGEHGKGFSVVAQEVKSLAQQSKQATTQVRSILNEIQKATSTAVMATEQGGKVVEKGTETANQAGQSIITLTEGLDQSADAATQIASASQQQRVGMDQITAAMESVREASQQNAASAKQLEGAVHGLKMLGEKLKGIVESYKI